MGYLRECWDFFREFRREYRNTGSLLPSSRFLGREMASRLAQPGDGRRILEAGPGTGAVTRWLLSNLRPHDHVDIVEINDRFISVLENRFTAEPAFRRYRSQVELKHAAVQELPGDNVYDFIISSLPLNNFPVDLVKTIFRAFERLLKPEGTLSYFEYAYIRQMKMPFVSREERRRLATIGLLAKRYFRRGLLGRRLVLCNFPPAFVQHLHLKKPISPVR
ncbi:MAG: hypothetical protein KatS3mg105_4755 [Gemmatales bacterium]|nr:MAG: hypothetical protein KatS3mg105_4755 [Gemmatales bacterium]